LAKSKCHSALRSVRAELKLLQRRTPHSAFYISNVSPPNLFFKTTHPAFQKG